MSFRPELMHGAVPHRVSQTPRLQPPIGTTTTTNTCSLNPCGILQGISRSENIATACGESKRDHDTLLLEPLVARTNNKGQCHGVEIIVTEDAVEGLGMLGEPRFGDEADVAGLVELDVKVALA